MPARKSAKPRQVRVNQEMLADEAEARIELGLHRISRAAQHRDRRDPLALYTRHDLARELGVPERYLEPHPEGPLGIVVSILELVVNARPALHMSARSLTGGLIRLDFNVGMYHETGDVLLTGQPGGVPLTYPAQPDELDALLNPPPDDPWANLGLNLDEQVGGLEPEPERPTGWQHIAKDDED